MEYEETIVLILAWVCVISWSLFPLYLAIDKWWETYQMNRMMKEARHRDSLRKKYDRNYKEQ